MQTQDKYKKDEKKLQSTSGYIIQRSRVLPTVAIKSTNKRGKSFTVKVIREKCSWQSQGREDSNDKDKPPEMRIYWNQYNSYNPNHRFQ